MCMIRHAATLVLFGAIAVGCGGDDTPASPSSPGAPFSQTDLRAGNGAEAVAGRTVTVNYTGWLYAPTQPEQKGQQFDTAIGRAPFVFVVGGVPGMRVGGLRRLVIPPDLAYGAQGSPPNIPPNATLVFDVELLAVQ